MPVLSCCGGDSLCWGMEVRACVRASSVKLWARGVSLLGDGGRCVHACARLCLVVVHHQPSTINQNHESIDQ